MKTSVIVIGGIGLLAASAGYFANSLASSSSSVQSGPLMNAGIFLIDNQNWIKIVGYVMLLIALILLVL